MGLIAISAVSLERAQAGEQFFLSGPKAAAGSLYLLARQGYTNLCPPNKNDSEAVMNITRILSSPRAMVSGIEPGTSTAFPIHAVGYYINAHGYVCSSLKFQGYRPCQTAYSAGTSPKLNWIVAGTRKSAGECVLIGWYEHDVKNNQYKRRGGQWLTVLGYQVSKIALGCPTVLVITDPTTGKRNWLYFEPLKFEEHKPRRLIEVDSHDRLTRTIYPEGPVYQVNSTLLGQGGLAILEGAVVFEVK